MKTGDKIMVTVRIAFFILYIFLMYDFINEKDGIDTDMGILGIISVTIILAVIYKYYQHCQN